MKTHKHPNIYVTLGSLRNCAEVKLDLVLKKLCLKRDLRAGELGYTRLTGELSKVRNRNSSHSFTLLFFACVLQVKFTFYELT